MMIIDDLAWAIGETGASPATHRLEMGISAKRALAAASRKGVLPRWFKNFPIAFVQHEGWDLVPLSEARPVTPTGLYAQMTIERTARVAAVSMS